MRFESQLSRMNCQTFSTGFNSGHLGGSARRVMLGGTTSRLERCHPAWSRTSTAWAEEDYALLRSLGIAVAREGIPWPCVDRGGRYDFSCLDPFIEAMNRN